MEKIVGEIVDDGLCGDDFELEVAVSAIEYEICQARKKAEKKGKDK